LTEYTKLRILTLDSVDRLRIEATGPRAGKLWTRSLLDLESEFDLKFIESEYDVDLQQELLLSSPGVAFRELDAANSQRIQDALPTLTPADATDERLWVTLALSAYRDYLLDRWPKNSDDLGNHIINHVFASTGRARERDHAIARLWWSGYYVRRFAPTQMDATLRAFFTNSDLPVQFLGRPNLATVGTLARATLAVFRKYFLAQSVEYKRPAVRAFFEGLDLLAGRQALGTLPQAQVDALVEACFRNSLALGAAES
jgi:hypothetical protein